jgi:hypothetical protein
MDFYNQSLYYPTPDNPMDYPVDYRQQGQFFPGGGGGGTNQRLTRLERQIERLDRRLDQVDRRLDRIERRLGFRPEDNF